MAKVYEDLLIKGIKNFNQVPKSLQKQVKELLDADGYIINPDGTVTKKEVAEEVE